jgi:hypothetical protein
MLFARYSFHLKILRKICVRNINQKSKIIPYSYRGLNEIYKEIQAFKSKKGLIQFNLT